MWIWVLTINACICKKRNINADKHNDWYITCSLWACGAMQGRVVEAGEGGVPPSPALAVILTTTSSLTLLTDVISRRLTHGRFSKENILSKTHSTNLVPVSGNWNILMESDIILWFYQMNYIVCRGDLLVPRVLTETFWNHRFTYAGPSAWSALPIVLRDNSLSLSCFKSKLKTHFFHSP